MMRSWKSSMVGLAMLIMGAIQGAHAKTFMEALSRNDVQVSLILSVLGFVAKDSDVSGQAPVKAIPVEVVATPPVVAATPAPVALAGVAPVEEKRII